ncbi:MAG: hypothetical protein HYZ53_00610 [Planctomycetes bacterium]|nr:hypothetical protein [Planctomycetota bacterium]
MAVLLLVKAWNGQLPRSSIAGILRGDEACSVVWNYGPERFAQFGTLRHLPYREVVRTLDLLVLKGYVRLGRGPGQRNKVWLGEVGEQALGATQVAPRDFREEGANGAPSVR